MHAGETLSSAKPVIAPPNRDPSLDFGIEMSSPHLSIPSLWTSSIFASSGLRIATIITITTAACTLSHSLKSFPQAPLVPLLHIPHSTRILTPHCKHVFLWRKCAEACQYDKAQGSTHHSTAITCAATTNQWSRQVSACLAQSPPACTQELYTGPLDGGSL